MSSGITWTCQRRAGYAIPAQRVLQNRLLLQQIGLRNHQVLLAGIQLRLRARDFDLGQRADGHLRWLSSSKCCAVATSCWRARTSSSKLTRSQYRFRTAETVVITCCLNCRSVTFRLFFCTRMLRPFTAEPKPLQQVLRHLQIQIAGGIGIQAVRTGC